MATEAPPRGLGGPAFYALRPGGWRDLVTILHPPYTIWHLSYVALGAAAAPAIHLDPPPPPPPAGHPPRPARRRPGPLPARRRHRAAQPRRAPRPAASPPPLRPDADRP